MARVCLSLCAHLSRTHRTLNIQPRAAGSSQIFHTYRHVKGERETERLTFVKQKREGLHRKKKQRNRQAPTSLSFGLRSSAVFRVPLLQYVYLDLPLKKVYLDRSDALQCNPMHARSPSLARNLLFSMLLICRMPQASRRSFVWGLRSPVTFPLLLYASQMGTTPATRYYVYE